MHFLSKSTIAIFAALMISSGLHTQKKTTLFSPHKKSEWHVYTARSGKNNDPQKVFQFEGNMIHVSGQDFAYLITEKKYSNFRLTVEFKWGEKKYPPRENAKRDAGILYHADLYSGDKIWPRSLEYQIQEGDCGDFWMTDSTTILHKDTLTTPNKGAFNVVKIKDAEKPTGQWNVATVIVKDGNITHVLNGEIVNSAKLGNTKEGNIVLQSEGAEIYYRNVAVEELK
ncbi:MAG: hypothetical protein JWP81_833 [Ferruginibacter sp.]|nr:hypothetical protein [Ferruginibacter sp.]